jgi:tetratricopeptide (TPR) repeat protein
MPDPASRLRQNPIRVDVPAWLSAAIEPWRIAQAWLWHSGGLALNLRSERATVPVLVEGPGPRVTIRERGVSVQRGAALERALARALGREPRLRAYLARLAALRERFDDGAAGDDEFGRVLDLWRAWPEREPEAGRQLEPLRASGDATTLPRAVRAALTLHRLASGEVLPALRQWAVLGEPGSSKPSFVEGHVDAIMLGLLGRRDEALGTLAQAQEFVTDAERWLAIARAYEALDAKDSAIAAHEHVVASRGDAWDYLRLARAGRTLTLDEIPRLEPGASVQERVTFVRSLVKLLDATGRFDDALTAIRELADDAPTDLRLRAATLHLWRCEGELARGYLTALADNPRAQLIEGALACIEGRPKRALEVLATIESDGSTRLDRLLWQAEAELALGRADAALDRVDAHIKLENSLVAYLLKFLILAAMKPAAELAESIASRTFLDALVPDVLPSLVEPDRLARAHADPREFSALLREILDAMGGNRGPTPTWLRRAEDGQRRLERVEVRPSGRDAAVANLVRVRTEPPEHVLAGFDAVAAEYPRSPHPWTYRGELLIWLGRYHDALACFAEADARAPTRWSFVGRAAAYDLLGESEQADHWTREGAIRFGELETATTHVYRGERLRRLGALADARRDLEIAVGSKSGRVGARINLALVYRALGDDAAWQRECDRLCLDAPALLWEAGLRTDRAIEVEDLHAALAAMVGNRSSFLHTILDVEERFRVLPESGRWVAHARLCLGLGARELERVLVDAWLGSPLPTA